MPNHPKTPLRSFRVSEALYNAAKLRAAANGESLSDIVRAGLAAYILDDVDQRKVRQYQLHLVQSLEPAADQSTPSISEQATN